jgi:hypothetical protein
VKESHKRDVVTPNDHAQPVVANAETEMRPTRLQFLQADYLPKLLRCLNARYSLSYGRPQ